MRVARRTESPEVGHPPRPGRGHPRRSDHGHLRVVELDQPVGHRPGRAQHLHQEAGHRRLVQRAVRAQVEQHRRRRRERDLRAAAARCADNADAGQRRDRPVHHGHVEVVRRSMGAPLRSLPRHGLGVHQSAGVHRPRRRPDEKDRDVAVQLRRAGHADPGHHLLLEGRRQDHGAQDQDQRRVDLHHRGTGAAAADQRHSGSRAVCVEGSGQGRQLAGESRTRPRPAAPRSATPISARRRSPPRARTPPATSR